MLISIPVHTAQCVLPGGRATSYDRLVCTFLEDLGSGERQDARTAAVVQQPHLQRNVSGQVQVYPNGALTGLVAWLAAEHTRRIQLQAPRQPLVSHSSATH